MPRIARKGKRRVNNSQIVKPQNPEAPPKASNPSHQYPSTIVYAEGDASDAWEETDDDEDREEGPSNERFPAPYTQYNQSSQPTGLNAIPTNHNEVSSTTRHPKPVSFLGEPSGPNRASAKRPQKPSKPSRLSKGYKHGNASIQEQATTLGPPASNSQHPAFDFQHSYIPNMPGMMDPSATEMPNNMRPTYLPTPRGGYYDSLGYASGGRGMYDTNPYGQHQDRYYASMQGHPAYSLPAHMSSMQMATTPPPPPPQTETPAAPAPPPKEDPEKIRLEAEIAAFKAMAEKSKATEREKELQERAREESEEIARRRAEEETEKTMARLMAEEEKAKIRAEVKAELARDEARRYQRERELQERVQKESEEVTRRREKEGIIARRVAEEERAKAMAEMKADMDRDERRRREDILWMRHKEAEIRERLAAERREKEEEEASKTRFRDDCERLAKLKMLKSIDDFMDTLKERLFTVELPSLHQHIFAGQENGIRVERDQPEHRRMSQQGTSPIDQPRLEESPSLSHSDSFASAEAFDPVAESKDFSKRNNGSSDAMRHRRERHHEREPQISEDFVQRVAHAVAKILRESDNGEILHDQRTRPRGKHQSQFPQTEPRTHKVQVNSPSLEMRKYFGHPTSKIEERYLWTLTDLCTSKTVQSLDIELFEREINHYMELGGSYS
ncbi:hypothetical protein FSARC_1693 [Fusarium sarcochroum]|uniref:Uncharacterized protein n=1 Tax=Fusarium sarcochroum TaxID=1208366 RepID=A0A8H4XEI8_9HYPO|nr:hypothetical protein FSARC_1693 [Fusarium sarcochroum]